MSNKTKRNYLVDTAIVEFKKTIDKIEVDEAGVETTKKIDVVYKFHADENAQSRLEKALKFLQYILKLSPEELGEKATKFSDETKLIAGYIYQSKTIDWIDADGNIVKLSIDDIEVILAEAMAYQYSVYLKETFGQL